MPTPGRPTPSFWRSVTRSEARAVLLTAGLFGLGAWIYWPALHGGWIWDDYMYIPQNPALRTGAGLGAIWFAPPGVNYFPVTFTVQWIQWHLWGNATFGYHLTNLALHVLNCILLGCILQRLAGGDRDRRTQGSGRLRLGRVGWAAAFLFAVHPLAVESVAWICELKNVLSLAFLFGAIIAYILYDEAASEPAAAIRRRLAYALSWFSFVLALLSKSTVVMFPAVMLLFCWWKRGRVRRADLLALLPFSIAALGLGLVTIWFEHHRSAAITDGATEGLAARVAAAGTAMAFYLWKSVLPFGLMPNYPRWSAAPASALQLLPWAALVALTAWLWTRRAAWGRTALFGWGCFLANLAPVLGLIPMAYMRLSWVADHFAYLSLVSVVGLTAAAWSASTHRAATDTAPARWFRRPPFLVGLLVALAAALAVRSRDYASIYRNEEAFWTYAAGKNPESWTALTNLGVILAQDGRVADALARYESALRLKPDYAGAHSDIANLLGSMPGRQDEAVAHYETALRLRPDLAGVHNNFAGLLAHLPGRQTEAIAHYETALRLKPDYAEAHKNLADLLAGLPGRQDEARIQYEAALRLNPDFAEAHGNLGLLLARQAGGRGEAISHLESALRLDPDFAEAHAILASLLAIQPGRQDEAIAHYETALRLQPNLYLVHFYLARELAKLPNGREEAARHYAAALAIKPDFTPAREALDALRRTGR